LVEDVPSAGDPTATKRLLAVSSGGGHWIELRRLREAFGAFDVVYASSDPSVAATICERHYCLRNVSRVDRFGLVVAAWQLARIIWRERPSVVVTTGAAPGVFALAIGKLFCGARTIWIDSVAASEHMSLSARLVRPVADVRLVQWAHLARPEGPYFVGSVV
jgi:UDP-N-acetylglucosamine:LPS N-acetylglucosamine transferase